MIENTEPSNAEPAPCSVPARHAIHLRGDCPVCLRRLCGFTSPPRNAHRIMARQNPQKYALFQHDSVPPWFCLSRLRSAVLRSLRPFVAVRGSCRWFPGSATSTISYQLSTTLLALLCTSLHYFAVILNHHESRFTFHVTCPI